MGSYAVHELPTDKEEGAYVIGGICHGWRSLQAASGFYPFMSLFGIDEVPAFVDRISGYFRREQEVSVPYSPMVSTNVAKAAQRLKPRSERIAVSLPMVCYFFVEFVLLSV